MVRSRGDLRGRVPRCRRRMVPEVAARRRCRSGESATRASRPEMGKIFSEPPHHRTVMPVSRRPGQPRHKMPHDARIPSPTSLLPPRRRDEPPPPPLFLRPRPPPLDRLGSPRASPTPKPASSPSGAAGARAAWPSAPSHRRCRRVAVCSWCPPPPLAVPPPRRAFSGAAAASSRVPTLMGLRSARSPTAPPPHSPAPPPPSQAAAQPSVSPPLLSL